MRLTTVDPAWVIFGRCRDIAYIGRDTIGTASGLYARFFDVGNRETRIERFDSHEKGDGASCIAGHSVASIFSLVERKPNPRILVFGYPSMRRIACCANSQEANGYICCTFAGTEYLLAQTIYPDFRIILWHWRTGEQMAAIDAGTIDLDRTIITCSSDSTQMVARLLPDSSTLSVYRIFVCSKLVRLFPVEAVMDSNRQPVSISWSTGGTLLLCDELGNIWSIDFDENENRCVRTIVQSESSIPSSRNPVLVAHKGGALIVVIPPKANSEVRATFYKKESKARSEKWRTIWTTQLPSFPSIVLSHPRDDKILILGESGDIFEMIDSSRDRTPRLEFLLKEGAEYTAIASFCGQYLGALDSSHRLAVLNASTGYVISSTKHLSLKHHGEVTRLVSHPSVSILATCSEAGSLLLVEASTPSVPKIVNCAHLQREPLDRLKFSERGRVLGVGSSRVNRLFLLLPTSSNQRILKVSATLNVQRKVIDFLIYEAEESYAIRVLVLVGGTASRNPRAGNEIMVYTCRLSGDLLETMDHAIKLSASFEDLFYGRVGSGDIFGAPYLSRQLRRIQLKVDSREVIVLDALSSLHQTRNVEVGIHCVGTRSCSQFLTCGYDGLIVLRDAMEPKRVFAVFAGHHRSQGGTRCAVIVSDVIVSLGRNEDLVANRLRQPILEYLPERSSSSASFFRWIPDEFGRGEARNTDEEEAAETWMDTIMRDRTTNEEKQDQSSRVSILEDFNELRCRVKELLDSNETESPDAQLPIGAFDLDEETRERKLAATRSLQEQLTKDAEERIAQREQAISYLRERFLNPLVVRPSSISAIFGESKVTNYPVEKISSEEADHRSWCRFSMETRELVTRLEEETSGVPETQRECNPFDPWRGYIDVLETCAITEEREQDSKIRFNELFERTRSAKRSETKMAIERAKRTRRCVDELKQTFRVDASSDLLDVSRWRQIETADEHDDFLPVHNDSILKDLEEEEDSPVGKEVHWEDAGFRREALERMMDGVLEVRLEDNAKKIIPKPECLDRKSPFSYTKEDIAAIESYEKKLQEQEAHRLEYRSMLEAEIERVKDDLSNAAKKFDDQLTELAAEKIRFERSVLLDRLSKVQTILGHRKITRQRCEIRRVIELDQIPATKQARIFAEECELFEAGVAELRIRYENLRKRDKLLEGKFRAEFEAELKQPMVEHLFRHYRRRPRTVGASCGTSLAFLAELAERAVGDRDLDSEILPREWQDYLRGLKSLDTMPNSLPQTIEPSHWHGVCRLRRIKVETEIKVRTCAIELAEAEQSLAFYRKACLAARATVNRHKETVQRLEKSLHDLTDDQEVTLVLKTGQLQTQPRGDSSSEWEDAVLIPHCELDRVHEAIVEAGEQKLAALQKVGNLQRTISLEEWRHALIEKTMKDLQEHLKDLSTVKVSKLMLECAARYPKGVVPKQETETLERNFRVRRTRLEEALEEERTRSRRIARETREWGRRNAKLNDKIERSKTERNELLAATRDPLRSKAAAFQRKKMRSIRRAVQLAQTVRANFEELVVLHSRLEISKLRTYPTLRLKD